MILRSQELTASEVLAQMIILLALNANMHVKITTLVWVLESSPVLKGMMELLNGTTLLPYANVSILI